MCTLLMCCLFSFRLKEFVCQQFIAQFIAAHLHMYCKLKVRYDELSRYQWDCNMIVLFLFCAISMVALALVLFALSIHYLYLSPIMYTVWCSEALSVITIVYYTKTIVHSAIHIHFETSLQYKWEILLTFI